MVQSLPTQDCPYWDYLSLLDGSWLVKSPPKPNTSEGLNRSPNLIFCEKKSEELPEIKAFIIFKQ